MAISCKGQASTRPGSSTPYEMRWINSNSNKDHELNPNGEYLCAVSSVVLTEASSAPCFLRVVSCMESCMEIGMVGGCDFQYSNGSRRHHEREPGWRRSRRAARRVVNTAGGGEALLLPIAQFTGAN